MYSGKVLFDDRYPMNMVFCNVRTIDKFYKMNDFDHCYKMGPHLRYRKLGVLDWTLVRISETWIPFNNMCYLSKFYLVTNPFSNDLVLTKCHLIIILYNKYIF